MTPWRTKLVLLTTALLTSCSSEGSERAAEDADASSSSGAGGASSSGSGGQGGPSSGTGGVASVTTDGAATSSDGGARDAGRVSVDGSGVTAACPADATFCSGFESADLPQGAIYMVNAAPGEYSRDFAIDAAQHHAGTSSLLVKNANSAGSSGSAYRMLAVQAPQGSFWVRFWVESDMQMGGLDHNAFAEASVNDMPNAANNVEFAEDVGIAFNTGDNDAWPAGYGRLSNGSTKPYSIPAMTWTCIEIHFDGTNRMQELFINGTSLIAASNYPPANLGAAPYAYFKFGFAAFHGPPRQMWYDDVAVAPSRVGCTTGG